MGFPDGQCSITSRLGSYNRGFGPGIENSGKRVGGWKLIPTLLDARNNSSRRIISEAGSWKTGDRRGRTCHHLAKDQDHIRGQRKPHQRDSTVKGGSTGKKMLSAQGSWGGMRCWGWVFLIENNYIEASRRNTIGGLRSGTTSLRTGHHCPTQTHRQAPSVDARTSPTFVGQFAFTVKALLRARKTFNDTLRDNICGKLWGGFSQDGYSVLLTEQKADPGQAP